MVPKDLQALANPRLDPLTIQSLNPLQDLVNLVLFMIVSSSTYWKEFDLKFTPCKIKERDNKHTVLMMGGLALVLQLYKHTKGVRSLNIANNPLL